MKEKGPKKFDENYSIKYIGTMQAKNMVHSFIQFLVHIFLLEPKLYINTHLFFALEFPIPYVFVINSTIL